MGNIICIDDDDEISMEMEMEQLYTKTKNEIKSFDYKKEIKEIVDFIRENKYNVNEDYIVKDLELLLKNFRENMNANIPLKQRIEYIGFISEYYHDFSNPKHTIDYMQLKIENFPTKKNDLFKLERIFFGDYKFMLNLEIIFREFNESIASFFNMSNEGHSKWIDHISKIIYYIEEMETYENESDTFKKPEEREDFENKTGKRYDEIIKNYGECEKFCILNISCDGEKIDDKTFDIIMKLFQIPDEMKKMWKMDVIDNAKMLIENKEENLKTTNFKRKNKFYFNYFFS
jgi:hypothetical protein